MAPPPTGSGSTWLVLGCAKCRRRFSVKWDAPPEARVCPTCHTPVQEGVPGAKLRALLTQPEERDKMVS